MKSKFPLELKNLQNRQTGPPSSRTYLYNTLNSFRLNAVNTPNATTRQTSDKNEFQIKARPPLKQARNISARPYKPKLRDSHRAASPLNKSYVMEADKDLFTGNIEEYNFSKSLGQGAYASVKQATHVPTKKIYAVKTYEKSKLLDPQKKRNVRKEIRIMQKLDHDKIIKCKEAIDAPRQIHIVMEYVGGLSLHGYIKKHPQRKLPEQEAKRLFKQVLSAVEYCHSKNVAHRDIKLENILLDSNNDVKLIDFGFSTIMPSDKKVKLFCGTPSYMAPEIVSRQEYSGQPADIWALGVLLFVLLCGTFPFKGVSDSDLYRRISKGYFDIPAHVNPQARLLIKRMMQTDPQRRPTASQVLKENWLVPPQACLGDFESINTEKDIFERLKLIGYSEVQIREGMKYENSNIRMLYRRIKEEFSYRPVKTLTPRPLDKENLM